MDDRDGASSTTRSSCGMRSAQWPVRDHRRDHDRGERDV